MGDSDTDSVFDYHELLDHSKVCFAEYENHANTKIPLSVKLMLKTHGFNNEFCLRQLVEEHLDEIENYARHTLLNIIKYSDRKKYYGVFARKPRNYIIAIGHRMIMRNIADYFNKKYKLKRQGRNAVATQ